MHKEYYRHLTSVSSILQAKGNAAFAAGNHEEAIKHFTEGIAVDPSNHVLYSNRSASYVSTRLGMTLRCN